MYEWCKTYGGGWGGIVDIPGLLLMPPIQPGINTSGMSGVVRILMYPYFLPDMNKITFIYNVKSK